MEKTKDVTKKTTEKKEEKVNVQYIDAFSIISLILGCAGMIAWIFPILGVSLAIPGLSIGIVTHEIKRSNYALIGIVMSLVGVILSIIKAFAM